MRATEKRRRRIEPLHVGSVLKEILRDYEITQSALAKHLNVDYVKINEICNGKRNLSTDMAMKLGKAFEALDLTYSFWVGIQKDYEQSLELYRNSELYEKIEPIVING